jgi:hypothetical protein
MFGWLKRLFGREEHLVYPQSVLLELTIVRYYVIPSGKCLAVVGYEFDDKLYLSVHRCPPIRIATPIESSMKALSMTAFAFKVPQYYDVLYISGEGTKHHEAIYRRRR